MSGRRSRNKGLNFERTIAQELRKIGFPKACRQLEYQEGLGIDIAHAGIIDIQAKAYKDYAPISKINEVPKKKGRVPVLVTKGDHKTPMAVLPFEWFLKFYKAYNTHIEEENNETERIRESTKDNNS